MLLRGKSDDDRLDQLERLRLNDALDLYVIADAALVALHTKMKRLAREDEDGFEDELREVAEAVNGAIAELDEAGDIWRRVRVEYDVPRDWD